MCESGMDAMSTETPRILIVEDDPMIMQMLSQMLKDMGSIERAYDIESAQQLLRAFDPHLVLLDLVIPPNDHSGNDLIRTMRSDDQTRPKPILVVSAASLELLGEAAKAGADLIIRKPFRMEWLRSDVEVLLRRAGF